MVECLYMKEHIQIKKIPQTIQEAVHVLTVEVDKNRVIEYLKNHPSDINEFCLQTVDAYNNGDNTGVRQLGDIIEELLRRLPKSKIERKVNEFKNYIEIGKVMTKEGAMKKLSSFHGASDQSIINAFSNLNNINEENGDFVIFEDSLNSGYPCISMRGYDKDKKFKSSSLIDKDTGQPMEHVG